MSNADPAEVSMVVSRDGVTVEKSFEPDDFPVPAIAFVIRAERDETVRVRLLDQVPDQVDAEDIGFHPKYGAEFWSVEEGNIVFEREFEAGEEYTTVYGLRASQTDDVESYMSEPTLEEVEPPLDDAGQVVRDVIGDDGGSSSSDIEAAIAAADADAESEPADTDTDDEPVEPLKLNDPNDGGDVEPEIESSTDADDAGGHDDADEDVVAEAEPESATTYVESGIDDPVAALAQQIRSGNADDEDIAALRRALGDGGDGSRDARIKQLQSELADLRAYTNALEEFLDENGDAQQLIREVKGDVKRVDSQLSSVESRADSAVTRVDDVEGEVGRVDDELDGLSSEIEDVRSQAEQVGTRMDEFVETVDQVEDDVESLHGEVDEVSSELSSVDASVDDVHDEVTGVDERVVELEGTVDDLEQSLDRVDDLDDRLDALEDEFADAREDLQSLSKMREQLSSVFGAQVQGPGGDNSSQDDDSDDADEE